MQEGRAKNIVISRKSRPYLIYEDLTKYGFISIPKKEIVRKVQKATGLKAKFIEFILDRDSDGVFYGFESKDWIKYFNEKMYL